MQTDENNSTIYIGGLPTMTSDAELREVFGQYGTISSSRVLNRENFSFAFIRYSNKVGQIGGTSAEQCSSRAVEDWYLGTCSGRGCEGNSLDARRALQRRFAHQGVVGEAIRESLLTSARKLPALSSHYCRATKSSGAGTSADPDGTLPTRQGVAVMD